jgi:hypothetical protein
MQLPEVRDVMKDIRIYLAYYVGGLGLAALWRNWRVIAMFLMGLGIGVGMARLISLALPLSWMDAYVLQSAVGIPAIIVALFVQQTRKVVRTYRGSAEPLNVKPSRKRRKA